MSTENTPKPDASRGEEILRLIQQRCQQHLGPGVEVKLILNQPEAPTEEQGQKFTFVPKTSPSGTDGNEGKSNNPTRP